jgi:urease accessory protein
MLTFTNSVSIDESHSHRPVLTLTLSYHLRQKNRMRVTLDNGEEAGLMLSRGQVLCGGDLLRADTGEVVQVLAASEAVSTVYTDDPLLLLRAAYHLGNRHVALQIGDGWLRYLSDHVLDGMMRQLGLRVVVGQAPFEPESGAYAGHSHQHG